MNQIAIKNNDIQLLEAFLKEKFSETSIKVKDNEIIVNLKDKIDKERLSLVLAVFITNSVEQEFIDKLKSAISKDKYNKNVFYDIQDEYKKFLYIEPIQILVIEHFKNNNKIDLESFTIFNCRGLKNEFFDFGKDLLQLYLEEFKNRDFSISREKTFFSNKEEGALSIDSAITYYSYIKELNDLIFKLKEESNIKKLDYKRFNEVHVKTNGNKIVLTDNENKIIDNELEGVLPINIINNLQGGDEILKVAITLITYISILNTSCVVIHKSIPNEMINRILLYLYDSREVNPELFNVNLLQCNKCNMCNLTT